MEKSIVYKEKEAKQYKIVKMIFEDDFNKTINELVLKSEYVDGVSFEDLLATFRQFLIIIGYTEESAKMVLSVSRADLENLGLNFEDLSIRDWN